MTDRLTAGRVLTLLGPGGVGKTRLSVAFAERWSGTVLFVDLQSAEDAADVRLQLAQAVGAQLREPIAPRIQTMSRPLLVLDNLEQVSVCNSQPERTPHLQLAGVCRTASREFANHAFASRGPVVGGISLDWRGYRSTSVAIAGCSTDPRVLGRHTPLRSALPPKGDFVNSLAQRSLNARRKEQEHRILNQSQSLC